MDIKQWIYHILSVPRCVCCRSFLKPKENVFCMECLSKYENAKMRNCSRCAKVLNECACTNRYLDAHLVHKLLKVTRYTPHNDDNPVNSLVFSLKQDHRSDVFDFVTRELSVALDHSDIKPDMLTFVSIPRRKEAKSIYGFDHAAELCKRLAKLYGAEHLPILVSKTRKAQKTLSAEERRKNVRFEIRSETDLSGRTVIIVDDIVTTGTSMAYAAMLLRSLGAKKLIGLCFSIAYRDDSPHEIYQV